MLGVTCAFVHSDRRPYVDRAGCFFWVVLSIANGAAAMDCPVALGEVPVQGSVEESPEAGVNPEDNDDAGSSSNDSSSSDCEAPQSAADWIAEILHEMGGEEGSATQSVFLGTISRVLPETLEATDLVDVTQLTREQVAIAVRKAFEEPIARPGRAGRPRSETPAGLVQKIVVFRETHSSGEPHFHVAAKLRSKVSWSVSKHTLRQRDHIPIHWSTNHTQWWSALRYGVVPSEKKPNVDPEPYQWTADGQALDLFAEAQEPYTAQAWKVRREGREKDAAAGRKTKSKAPPAFRKLDLTSIILEQGLLTPAAVMDYTKRHGTATMQEYVHKNQRKLKEFLDDAKDWHCASEVVASEAETDWALVCRRAEEPCPQGASCSYAVAASQVFELNAEVLSRPALASALRAILVMGPSKTTRTPLIVGPTNTGKTTLILPFDKVFGAKSVFHKPVLGSKYALRNLMKNKRFILWDDYRPVEYAQETIPVNTFLSLFTGLPFEVQLSQTFNDGNEDFAWRQGAVLTAKEEGLWNCFGSVTPEDIRHMQSRVEVFRCTAAVAQLRDVEPCAQCMCKWIRDESASLDASAALQLVLPVLPVLPSSADGSGVADAPAQIEGFEEFVAKARVPARVAKALKQDLFTLGAVNVEELTLSDWTSLSSWQKLRFLEQRRLSTTIADAASARNTASGLDATLELRANPGSASSDGGLLGNARDQPTVAQATEPGDARDEEEDPFGHGMQLG